MAPSSAIATAASSSSTTSDQSNNNNNWTVRGTRSGLANTSWLSIHRWINQSTYYLTPPPVREQIGPFHNHDLPWMDFHAHSKTIRFDFGRHLWASPKMAIHSCPCVSWWSVYPTSNYYYIHRGGSVVAKEWIRSLRWQWRNGQGTTNCYCTSKSPHTLPTLDPPTPRPIMNPTVPFIAYVHHTGWCLVPTLGQIMCPKDE